MIVYYEYPPAGWIGWCTTAECAGQVPKGVILGYEYDSSAYYFVFYITFDATDGTTDENGHYVFTSGVQEWWDAQYSWTVQGQPLPSSDTVTAILTAIGAYNSGVQLTVTLLYRASVDLDMHFYCDNGAHIYYGAPNVGDCQASLDHDDQAGAVNNVYTDADGNVVYEGQVENISVGTAVDGHTYNGKINYFSGSEDTPFQVVFSGFDGAGNFYVFDQVAVESFTTGDYTFTYTHTAP